MISYAWCETCLSPVERADVSEPEEEIGFGAKRILPARVIRIDPCRHGPNYAFPDGRVFSVGIVSVVEGDEPFVGPIPAISIAGFDPSRFADSPGPMEVIR